MPAFPQIPYFGRYDFKFIASATKDRFGRDDEVLPVRGPASSGKARGTSEFGWAFCAVEGEVLVDGETIIRSVDRYIVLLLENDELERGEPASDIRGFAAFLLQIPSAGKIDFSILRR